MVADSTLVLTREIDLPREIVWDAIVDDALVSGWLAEASIEPRVDGHYDLAWFHREHLPATRGEITLLEQPAALEVDTSNVGLLLFELENLDWGTRGRSTLLRLTIIIDTEPAFATSMKAHWLSDLEQLEDLLRGHPVDWANWERDRHEAWSSYASLRGSNSPQ